MWLISSILSSAALMVIFKFFARFEIRVFPSIVVNYVTCFVLGNVLLGEKNIAAEAVWNQHWFPYVVGMGLLFISAFYLMGLGTGLAGAGATSVAAKMSVVIPAAVSLVVFHEKPGFFIILGMLLSIFCVYLMRPENSEDKGNRGLWILLLVFLGSGMVDTGLNLVKHHFGADVDDYTMSTVVFGGAGLIGLVLMLLRKGQLPGMKELLGGVVLGCTNYASLIAMFGAIGNYKGETAWFFAVNNIGVVWVSTLISMLFFKERISKMGYAGLLLAAVAVLLMNVHAFFG
jgi:drug/metabolite transporter (DMT)-like permease